MAAVRCLSDDAVCMLLNAKADVNAEDNNGNAALCMLDVNRTHSHVTRAQLLLNNKADSNIISTTTTSLMTMAYSLADTNCMKLLLEARADVSDATPSSITLIKAVMINLQGSLWYMDPKYVELMFMLIEAKANINVVHAAVKTALLNECIKRNDTAGMRTLLNAVKQANNA